MLIYRYKEFELLLGLLGPKTLLILLANWLLLGKDKLSNRWFILLLIKKLLQKKLLSWKYSNLVSFAIVTN